MYSLKEMPFAIWFAGDSFLKSGVGGAFWTSSEASESHDTGLASGQEKEADGGEGSFVVDCCAPVA